MDGRNEKSNMMHGAPAKGFPGRKQRWKQCSSGFVAGRQNRMEGTLLYVIPSLGFPVFSTCFSSARRRPGTRLSFAAEDSLSETLLSELQRAQRTVHSVPRLELGRQIETRRGRSMGRA